MLMSDSILKLVKNASSAFGAIVLVLHPLAQAIHVEDVPTGTFQCFHSHSEFFFANQALFNTFVDPYLQSPDILFIDLPHFLCGCIFSVLREGHQDSLGSEPGKLSGFGPEGFLVRLIAIGFRFGSENLTKIIGATRAVHLIEARKQMGSKLLLAMVAPELACVVGIGCSVFFVDHVIIVLNYQNKRRIGCSGLAGGDSDELEQFDITSIRSVHNAQRIIEDLCFPTNLLRKSWSSKSIWRKTTTSKQSRPQTNSMGQVSTTTLITNPRRPGSFRKRWLHF